jgi:hypothetical protein
MEGPFIIFALNDPCGWTDKREKGKDSVHKKLSYKMKDEKWWQRKTLVQFR